MKTFCVHALCWFRNRIWDLRRAIRGDPFEREREPFFCGLSLLDLATAEQILSSHSYVLNEVLQYEDRDQVLSGHFYYDFKNGVPERQKHIRIFPAASYNLLEIRSHDEFSWVAHPIWHLLGKGVLNDCAYVSSFFSLSNLRSDVISWSGE